MVFYLLSIRRAGTHSLLRIFIQKFVAKVSRSRCQKVILKVGGLVFDVLIELVPVFIVKWWQTHEHLINNRTEGPPVRGLTMALSLKNFRTQILSGTAQTCRVFCTLNILLAQAEVSEAYVAIAANKYIFWLQISVENVFRV